jgi:uncharacterized FlaG/YvyC family protein
MNITAIDTTRDQVAATGETAVSSQTSGKPAPAGTASAAGADQDKGKAKDAQGASASTEELLKKAQDHFQTMGVNLQFKLNNASGDMQVDVVDPKTQQVIMKIPQDDLTNLAGNLQSMTKGVMHRAV